MSKIEKTKTVKGIVLALVGLMMVLVSGHLAVGVHEAWNQSFLEAWTGLVSALFLGGAVAMIVSGTLMVCGVKMGGSDF